MTQAASAVWDSRFLLLSFTLLFLLGLFFYAPPVLAACPAGTVTCSCSPDPDGNDVCGDTQGICDSVCDPNLHCPAPLAAELANARNSTYKARLEAAKDKSQDRDIFNSSRQTAAQLQLGWCKVDFNVLTGIIALIDAAAAGQFGGIASAIWAAIKAALRVVVQAAINALVNALCNAIISAIQAALALICIPNLSINVSVPNFVFPRFNARCNGWQPFTATGGVAYPPPPAAYRNIPGIRYTGHTFVIR